LLRLLEFNLAPVVEITQAKNGNEPIWMRNQAPQLAENKCTRVRALTMAPVNLLEKWWRRRRARLWNLRALQVFHQLGCGSGGGLPHSPVYVQPVQILLALSFVRSLALLQLQREQLVCAPQKSSSLTIRNKSAAASHGAHHFFPIHCKNVQTRLKLWIENITQLPLRINFDRDAMRNDFAPSN
jgi:hypothetical protein